MHKISQFNSCFPLGTSIASEVSPKKGLSLLGIVKDWGSDGL